MIDTPRIQVVARRLRAVGRPATVTRCSVAIRETGHCRSMPSVTPSVATPVSSRRTRRSQQATPQPSCGQCRVVDRRHGTCPRSPRPSEAGPPTASVWSAPARRGCVVLWGQSRSSLVRRRHGPRTDLQLRRDRGARPSLDSTLEPLPVDKLGSTQLQCAGFRSLLDPVSIHRRIDRPRATPSSSPIPTPLSIGRCALPSGKRQILLGHLCDVLVREVARLGPAAMPTVSVQSSGIP